MKLKRQVTSIYEMRRDGWRDYFELRVSKTQKAMLADIKMIFKKSKHPIPDNFESTLGLVSPMYRSSGGQDDGLFAFCFLNEEHLGVGIVAHECLHIAMAHERFVLQFKMEYGPGLVDNSLEDEERLAHFFGNCVAKTYCILYDNKHIKGHKK